MCHMFSSHVKLLVCCKFLLRTRKEIRTHVGDLDVAAVPCGFGRAIGNKVGLTLSPLYFELQKKIFCLLSILKCV